MSKDDWNTMEYMTEEEFYMFLSCIEYTLRKNFNWGSDSPAIGVRGSEQYPSCKTLVYRDCFYNEHTVEYYDDGHYDYYTLLDWILSQVIWTYENDRGFIQYIKRMKRDEEEGVEE